MQELAQSIREQGMIVPIKVRPVGSDYEIVYGHRRVEAARRAGLEEIPAIVEGVEDTDALIQALIENTQREDMSVLDKARAFRSLLEETGWSMSETERRGVAPNNTISKLLTFLREYEAGAAVLVDESTAQGPRAQGLNQTLEINASLGDDIQAKRQVATKVSSEGLTRVQTRRVADAYRDARTDDEREAILKVRGDHPAFERAVAVQMGVDRAEEIQERKTTRRHQENDREVAQFFDAVRAFMMVVETMISAVDFGKFSQEGARFATRRIDALIEKLQQLKGQLNNE